jgi:hypothetical protein
VEATATETASASYWSSPATTTTAGTATTAKASSATVIAITLRLPDQSRARNQRDPIQFSFHDFNFLCVDAFKFISLNGLAKAARERDRC